MDKSERINQLVERNKHLRKTLFDIVDIIAENQQEIRELKKMIKK